MATLGTITDWWLGADGKLHTYGSGTVITPPPPPPPPAPPAVTAKIVSTSGLQVVLAVTAIPAGTNTIPSFVVVWGDGTQSPTFSGATLTHAYTSAGTYTITAIAIDNTNQTGKATAAATVAVPVNKAPVASFVVTYGGGADPTTDSLRINVDASASSDADGTIAQYNWDFGNGAAYASANPVAAGFYYQVAGTYTVTLVVTDDKGTKSAPVSKQVTVTKANQAPVASLSVTTSGATVSYDASGSSDPDGNTLTYSVAWGDGATSTGRTGAHTYTAQGPWTVVLTVTDTAGLSDTDSKSVTPTVSTGGGGGSSGANGDSGVNQTGVAGKQQTSGTQYQTLSGSTVMAKVKSAGTNIVSFAAGTYQFSDFLGGVDGGTSSSGNTGSGLQFSRGCKGVLGAGSASTVFSMVANSSNRASTVPAQSTKQTNQLQYIDIDSVPDGFVLDGIKIVGTAQGHLYNGLRIHNPGNSTFQNFTITGIPGDNSSPPGETFMMNVFSQPAGKKMTIKNATFDGAQNGTRVGAALLGTNGTYGQIDIIDCLFENQQYSSTVTIWELGKGGVINIIRPVTKLASRRNIGNEAQGGTINIYDPIFVDPASGSDDIRVTWTSNFNEGTVNVYFTSQANWDAFVANRTNKKLLTICTVKQSYGGSAGGAYTGTKDIRNYCHLFIGGVEVDKTNRWTFTGQPVN